MLTSVKFNCCESALIKQTNVKLSSAGRVNQPEILLKTSASAIRSLLAGMDDKIVKIIDKIKSISCVKYIFVEFTLHHNGPTATLAF